MKVLLAFGKACEANILSDALECLGHKTCISSGLLESAKVLHAYRPDLVVTEERLRQDQAESGLQLARLCRIRDEQQGCRRAQCLIVLSTADWDGMNRARRTGAHVVVKARNFDALVRYVQTIADGLTNDRSLGPILYGVHRFGGPFPHSLCEACCWDRASVAYGTSEADIDLTPVRSAILSALFRRRRGQSAAEIAWAMGESPFLRSILKGRVLKETAVKMEVSRIRDNIGNALESIGVLGDGARFLPVVPHGIERYRLNGNWQVLHVPVSSSNGLAVEGDLRHSRWPHVECAER